MELPHSSPAKCELRSVIRFLNAKNNSPVEIHRQLVEVYGEKCMDIKNVRKWKVRRTDVFDRIHLGAPLTCWQANFTHGSDRSLSHITNRSTAHSVCNASSSVCAYHSTPFTAEWSVCKTSIASIVFTDESRFCLQHHGGGIRVWRQRGVRMLNSCVMHRHTGPAPGIRVWGGIGYHSRTPLVRIAGTLNSQRYISENESMRMSKRYLNINIHSRTKVWNLGLTRISGVFSSEQCKYVIGAKLLEFGIDFETDIRVVPEFVSATVNEAESDLSEDDNEDTSPFNVSLEVAHPSFPEAIYPQYPVFSKKNINEVTKKARVVVKLFKRSPLKNEILLNYMRQDNRISTSMCLILDCRTRWDSLLNMLERLLSVKSAIQKALIDVKAKVRLTDEDFDIMTQVISALKPFRAAMASICRHDATLLTAEATVKFLLEELKHNLILSAKICKNLFRREF
ncbi:ATP6V0B [Cordylochernes scorpioides]|uniref:ATP6V0B n=1 Tax=Cordylochernes scorpioides TaxID=51811 RepID=A0ABY6JVG4_9ARAC|nr:ATP6V0B [Cordylochernes scorpioides]